MISRREFVALAGAFAILPRVLLAEEKFPSMLDHLLLGCSDLDRGITFVEQQTGAKPAIGGVHPGRGTRNALLSLGEMHYLEIIAPDPAQTEAPKVRAELPARLKLLRSPTLVDWAVHTTDIQAVAERLHKAGVAFFGPTPGSRARPDGKTLHWQSLNLEDDRQGLLPFFIEWSKETIHPSKDAPQGCTLESFGIVSPDSAALSSEFQKLSLEVHVENGSPARLRARIQGPKGTFALE